MKIFALFFLLVLAGCSREQTLEIGASLGKSYNVSYRDGVIKNWQAKVASAPACLGFKERFKAAGTRYDSAANGMFVQDMTTVWSDTKAAGCAAAV